jgi:hypothetical protein
MAARTNPYKRKPRCAKTTLLIFGEGLGEETFLKYLKGLYARDSGKSVKILNGKGGSAVGIVQDAARRQGAFDRRVVVLDNDKGGAEMVAARNEAKNNGIELVENTPCLEAVLLAVLNQGKTFSCKTTALCKKEFESKHLDKQKRTQVREYEKVFPQKLLDERRSNVAELDRLIGLME